MTTKFPDTFDYAGFNAPMRTECDIYDLVVEGNLPKEINGSWYRTIPDPQYPPMLGHDTYLSGDGMISAFKFENGHVDFKMKYIMTDRLKADRKARRGLFGLYRNPYTDDPSVKGIEPLRQQHDADFPRRQAAHPQRRRPRGGSSSRVARNDRRVQLSRQAEEPDHDRAHAPRRGHAGPALFRLRGQRLGDARRFLLRGGQRRPARQRGMVPGSLRFADARFRRVEGTRHFPRVSDHGRPRPDEGRRRSLGLRAEPGRVRRHHAARRPHQRHALVQASRVFRVSFHERVHRRQIRASRFRHRQIRAIPVHSGSVAHPSDAGRLRVRPRGALDVRHVEAGREIRGIQTRARGRFSAHREQGSHEGLLHRLLRALRSRGWRADRRGPCRRRIQHAEPPGNKERQAEVVAFEPAGDDPGRSSHSVEARRATRAISRWSPTCTIRSSRICWSSKPSTSTKGRSRRRTCRCVCAIRFTATG